MQDGGVGEVLGDAGLPLGGAGGVDAGAEAVDSDGDGHVDDIKFIDRFHAEVGEGEDAGGRDGLGDGVGRAADGDEVEGLELADGGDGFRAALGLADGVNAPPPNRRWLRLRPEAGSIGHAADCSAAFAFIAS